MISGSEVSSVVSTYLHGTAPTQARPATTQPEGAKANGDGITLSSRSESVTRILSALRDVPDIRGDRVLEARSRVESGKPPSSTDVARQILSRVLGDHLAAGR